MIGVGALIIEDERIVLVKRGRPPSMGEWSIPGGLVHLGETLEQAVCREAAEETGLLVRPLALVELLERIFPDEEGRIKYHYVLADYLCHVVEGTLRHGSDADAAEWVNYLNLETFSVAPASRKVIDKAFQVSNKS